MGGKRDPIAMVEACYDLAASESEWMLELARRARPLMQTTDVLTYHVDVDEHGMHFRNAVSAAGDADVVARIQSMGLLLDRRRHESLGLLDRLRAGIYERVVRAAMRTPADRVLLSEIRTYGPRWMYTLGVPGVYELTHLLNQHIDGQGLTALIGPRPKDLPLHARDRVMLQMLSAHIKAGLRLRRRLREAAEAVRPSADGAVLDADARVVHAEGEARSKSAQDVIMQRARDIERARTKRHGRDDDALEVWQGLIDGRWSLVERFDADGKRYLLAHQNPEHVRDPRGLSDIESRVTGLAARGYSNKLIAYHLGLAEGSAAGYLAAALRKLGLADRADLVRTLGACYPEPEPVLGSPRDPRSS